MTDMQVADAANCLAWALPLDGTGASAARALVAQTLKDMRLPRDLIDDAILAVGELAANVYQHVFGVTPQPSPGIGGGPELWLYRRGVGIHTQFVCKVFDSKRRWMQRRYAQSGSPNDDLLEYGRGLQLVEAVTAEWGSHRTRSRIGCSVPGKAVWFAMAIPPTHAIGSPHGWSCVQAAYDLQVSLLRRGIPNVIRCDNGAQSVLSVTHGLTVWCRDQSFIWTIGSKRASYSFSDLTEVAEHLVRVHEEIRDGQHKVQA
jgi:hypothetical protein